ncbi:uncharacterized protein EDB91DRAFT_1263073 [Suillus paluster]|uniref:uncharacterized protein n=1 Tax=Suillus paluster TaxID=48578 RepID=UPI001B85B7E1|nr:uncharacterized protein EDB91DRAFT_1263073 [Suillus paluster]KAG1747879.1 hypothetical protein EDB91DRAFT_1263073 [Suillus paluster]
MVKICGCGGRGSGAPLLSLGAGSCHTGLHREGSLSKPKRKDAHRSRNTPGPSLGRVKVGKLNSCRKLWKTENSQYVCKPHWLSPSWLWFTTLVYCKSPPLVPCLTKFHSKVRNAVSPQVGKVVQDLLKLSDETNLNILNHSMEAMINRFQNELLPVASQLTTRLCESYLRLAREGLAQQNEAVLDHLDVDSLVSDGKDDKVYGAMGIAKTIGIVVSCINSLPEILSQVQEVIIPIIQFTFENKLINLFDNMYDLVDALTFRLHAISPNMWLVFKLTYDLFKGDAVDLVHWWVLWSKTREDMAAIPYKFIEDQMVAAGIALTSSMGNTANSTSVSHRLCTLGAFHIYMSPFWQLSLEGFSSGTKKKFQALQRRVDANERLWNVLLHPVLVLPSSLSTSQYSTHCLKYLPESIPDHIASFPPLPGNIDLQNGSYFTTKTLNAFLLVTSDFLGDLLDISNIFLGCSFRYLLQHRSKYVQGTIFTLLAARMSCALGCDRQLKDASAIDWYNDPDDDTPMCAPPPLPASNDRSTVAVIAWQQYVQGSISTLLAAQIHVWKWYIQGPISTLPMSCALRPDGQLKDAKDIEWYNDPDDDSPMPPSPPPATSNGKITAFVSRHSGRAIKPMEKIRDAVNGAPAKRPAPATPEALALVGQVWKSPQARTFFHKCCAEVNEPNLKLLKWIRTRWASLFGMLERTLKLHKGVNRFIQLADDSDEVQNLQGKSYGAFKLSAEEWKKLELMHDMLQEPANAQQSFSATRDPGA